LQNVNSATYLEVGY